MEVIRGCGINNIVRNNTSHMPRIIMYHGFCSRGEKDLKRTPIDEFRKQLSYIKKYFFPLKVSDLIIAPSFDDNALEILKKKKNGNYLIIKADPNYKSPEIEKRE